MSIFHTPRIDPSRDVRLLEVHKIGTDLLKCSFHVEQMYRLSTTKYEALSYTWGANPRGIEELNFIWIENNRFCVRRNVFNFLLAWAPDSGESAGDSKLVFIDAVCINQQDDHEKCHQVLCMRDVFGKAESVVIWLWEPGNTPMTWHAIFCADDQNDRRAPGELANVSDLFNCRYWSRVWIVQEVLLAKRLLLLTVGKGSCKMLDLDAFIRSTFTLRLQM